jgi:hypothetical protein
MVSLHLAWISYSMFWEFATVEEVKEWVVIGVRSYIVQQPFSHPNQFTGEGVTFLS